VSVSRNVTRRAAGLLALALLAGGCSSATVEPLAVTAVEPGVGLAGVSTAVAIRGSGFRPKLSADFGGGEVSGDPRFGASLGGLELRAVVYVDATRLDAEVPAELPAGLHALTITDPEGRTATLAGAFLQLAPDRPCGDGVVDAAAGEVCDPGAPASDACCDPVTCTFVAAGAADPQGRCVPPEPCQAAACGAAGACLRGPKPDGTLCTSDGLFCDGEERCAAGSCASAGPPCAAAAACSEALDRCVRCGDGVVDAAAGETCDPGAPASSACCDPGSCTFAPAGAADPQERCTAADDCHVAACDGAGGCAGSALADGTACTNDGLYCSGPEACLSGRCTSAGDPCDAPAACNEIVNRCVVCGDGVVDLAGGESCDPADPGGGGCCDPVSCRWAAAGVPDPQGGCTPPDGCSTAACDGAGGCALTPLPDGLACADDGQFCSGPEACLGGSCQPAGDPCAPPEVCSEAARACVRCGDGIVQAAAGEQCDAGGGADPCCDPVTCRYASAGTACQDGLFCTSGDACDGAGACTGGPSPCAAEVVAEEGFEALPAGTSLGLDPEWTIADGGFAGVAGGCGSAASLGSTDPAALDATAALLATWTARPFALEAALVAVSAEAAFETDGAGRLSGDRVGWSIGGSASLHDFFGLTADTEDAGGAGIFLSYSSGAAQVAARLAALPPLTPASWYLLRGVFTPSGAGSLRVEASLTRLDAACTPIAVVATAPALDTATLTALPPRAAHLGAPVLVPALANGGRAGGRVDALRFGLDHGGATTACAGCDEAARRCFAPMGTACASDGAHCTGEERCDGAGWCAGEGDPCPRGSACGACDESGDRCDLDAAVCGP